jgi:hypothetical protein
MGAPITAPGTGHIDIALTTYATGYRNGAFVSDLLFPRVPVTKDTGKYYKFGREAQKLEGSDLRAFGAGAEAVRMALSSDSYVVNSHARKGSIPDETAATYEPGSLEQATAGILMDKILLQKEKEAAEICVDSTKITQYTTLTDPAAQWNDPDNSNPLADIITGKQAVRAIGVDANVMVVGPLVFDALMVHSKVKEAFKYTRPGIIGVPELAAYFNVAQFLIGGAIVVDEAGTASYPWGKNVFLAYVQPNASMADPSFGKSFVWQNGPGTVGGIGTLRWRDADESAKTSHLSVDFYYGQKVTFLEAAYLIKAAVL